MLDQLPEDYVLQRVDGEWFVFELTDDYEGYALENVSCAATPEAAVEAALVALVGKCSDWEPRKKLTGPAAFIPDLWGKALLDSVEFQSVIAKRLREPFPYPSMSAGATITIPRIDSLD